MNALKPHQFKRSRIVAKLRNQSFSSACAYNFMFKNVSFDLHKIGIEFYVADFIYLRSVDMAQRKMIEQIAESVNVQLFAQQIAFQRTNAFEILDWTV